MGQGESDKDQYFLVPTGQLVWTKFLPYIYDGLDRIALLRDIRTEGVVLVAGIYAKKSKEGNVYKRLDTRQMALAEKEIRAREKGIKEIRFLQLESNANNT